MKLAGDRKDCNLLISTFIGLVLIVLPFSSYSDAAPYWQPFAAGGAGWEILDSGSAKTYRFNGVERLFYNSNIGQWSQKGQLDGGTWSNLGSAGQSSTFIGDGKEYSIGSGWSYMYNGSNSRKQDSAWFSLNGNYRLAYNYTEGQWWQKGVDWSKVGSAGLSTAFIGDGTDRSIGAGWSYMYNGSNARKQDSAWFSFNGSYRLAYNYTEGQWWQKGVDWSKLGSAGLSTTFIGDGTDRSIGAGLSYMYNGSNARKQDSAWFGLNGNYRLAYNYTEGQWWQKGVDWSKLGSAGLSTTFIGDGTDRSIGAGWSFTYNGLNARQQDSVWFAFNGTYRLAYNYTEGQWWQKGIDWSKLGTAGISSKFIGDGTVYYSIDNEWSYAYSPTRDQGTWKNGEVERFTYDNATGLWSTYGVDKVARPLGSAGLSSDFIGLWAPHSLGTNYGGGGWKYRYNRPTDIGYWTDGSVDRFSYNYATGQWSSYGFDGVACPLGSGGISADFVGNGDRRDIGDGWGYYYNAPNHTGVWRNLSFGDDRFLYKYETGQWLDYEYNVAKVSHTLGSAGKSVTFIGNQSKYDLGLGSNIWFRYSKSTDETFYDVYKTTSPHWEPFWAYQYQFGTWLFSYNNSYRSIGTSDNHSSRFQNIQSGDLGFRYKFASPMDPADYNILPGINTYISMDYDTVGDAKNDRINYFNIRGDLIATGKICYFGDNGYKRVVDQVYMPGHGHWSFVGGPTGIGAKGDLSPVLSIYDNSDHLLYKHSYEMYIYRAIGETWVTLNDGRAIYWEDSNENGNYDNSDHFIIWHQQKGGTCAIFTDINIASSVMDGRIWNESSIDSAISYYNGKYDPTWDFDSDPNLSDWPTVSTFGNFMYITDIKGFKNYEYYATNDLQGNRADLDLLVSKVESGWLVGVGLDAFAIAGFIPWDGASFDSDQDGYRDANQPLYWQPSGPTVNYDGPGYHTVWVRGFAKNSQGTVTYVVIADSGKEKGAFGYIPVRHFMRAWALGPADGYFMVAAQPPNGFTWTDAGVRTWSHNPGLWNDDLHW